MGGGQQQWKTGGPEQRLGIAELQEGLTSHCTLRYDQLGQGGRASESVKVIPREVTRPEVPRSVADPHHHSNLPSWWRSCVRLLSISSESLSTWEPHSPLNSQKS